MNEQIKACQELLEKLENNNPSTSSIIIPFDNIKIHDLDENKEDEKLKLIQTILYHTRIGALDKLLGDHIIKLYKKENGDYKVLAYELQKAESNLIFNKIIRQVITLYPEINIVTVHDSIIIPESYRDSVWSIFQTKLYEEFGLI